MASPHIGTIIVLPQIPIEISACSSARAYALLITYQKAEREFSPSLMYADYPISSELLHWESQANTAW
jgi:hypothetical protein